MSFPPQRAASGRSNVRVAAVAVALIFGILSGLRWPDGYTASQMIVDYSFGFGKRGLLGWILSVVDRQPYHYRTIAWISLGCLLAWLVTIALLIRDTIGESPVVAICSGLFFLSIGFSAFVDDVGRGEHFGLLLCALCLLMRAGLSAICVRAVLLVGAVLVQEVNYVIFAPIIAFDLWLALRDRPLLERCFTVVLMALPAGALTWYLGHSLTACDTAAATATLQRHVADFEVQWRPVATLCNGPAENLLIVKNYLWGVQSTAVLVPLTFVVAVPLTIFVLCLTFRMVAISLFDRVLCTIVVFSPVVLILVAADVVRFMTLIQLTSFLAMIATARRLKPSQAGGLAVVTPRREIVWLFIAFELGSSLPLNDGTYPLKFPFVPWVQTAVAVLSGHASLLPVPPR